MSQLYRSECVLPEAVELAVPGLRRELELSVTGSWMVVGSSRLLPDRWGDIDLVAPFGYTEADGRWTESEWHRPPQPPCRCHRSFAMAPSADRDYWVALKLVPMAEYERIVREYEAAEERFSMEDRLTLRRATLAKWDFYRVLGITVGYANDKCEVTR